MFVQWWGLAGLYPFLLGTLKCSASVAGKKELNWFESSLLSLAGTAVLSSYCSNEKNNISCQV